MLNQVTLIGHLGANPEIIRLPAKTPDGKETLLASFSLATNRSWTDRNTGEKKQFTEWHRIILFKRLAEIAAEYTHKGSKVYIQGYLQTRSYKDKNGETRWVTEIVGEQIILLDKKDNANNNPINDPGYIESVAQDVSLSEQNYNDSIPF